MNWGQTEVLNKLGSDRGFRSKPRSDPNFLIVAAVDLVHAEAVFLGEGRVVVDADGADLDLDRCVVRQ